LTALESFDADVELQRPCNNFISRHQNKYSCVAPVVLRVAFGGILPRVTDIDAE
jgi:hypothetical protein